MIFQQLHIWSLKIRRYITTTEGDVIWTVELEKSRTTIDNKYYLDLWASTAQLYII